jgi:diketogulonate reductase-like aldo/keto reductase
MSRALNIRASEEDILATCAKRNIPISAIEPLASGGTRVVMNNAADTAAVAKRYGSKVIQGDVTRVATRLMRGG